MVTVEAMEEDANSKKPHDFLIFDADIPLTANDILRMRHLDETCEVAYWENKCKSVKCWSLVRKPVQPVQRKSEVAERPQE